MSLPEKPISEGGRQEIPLSHILDRVGLEVLDGEPGPGRRREPFVLERPAPRVDEARDAACEAQYELFREYLPERFPTPKHCRRGLELYDACTFLVAQYIRESGYDKSGYFAAMDARASEEEYVTAELNFRLNELLEEKRKVAMA